MFAKVIVALSDVDLRAELNDWLYRASSAKTFEIVQFAQTPTPVKGSVGGFGIFVTIIYKAELEVK